MHEGITRAYEDIVDACGGNSSDAYDEAVQSLRSALAGRTVCSEHPEEHYLRSCLHLLKGEFSLEAARPQEESETVVVATIKHQNMPSPDDASHPGRTNKVIFKIRGKYPDASTNEATHFKLARHIGLGSAVAPSIPFTLDMTSIQPDATPTLQCALKPLFAEVCLRRERYIPDTVCCTAELFVPLLSASIGAQADEDGAYPLSHHSHLFLKRFLTAAGSCDAAQAYTSTQCGGEAQSARRWHCDTSIFGSVADADLVGLMNILSQSSVEKLVVLAAVVFERDGGLSNLMFTIKRSEGGSSEVPCFEADLVAVDNTHVLTEHSEQRVLLGAVSSDTLGEGEYAYPAVLGLPGALQPLSAGMRDTILGWDTTEIGNLLRAHLLSNGHPALNATQKCLDRIKKLQHLVTSHPRMSLFDLASEVIPVYKRDFQEAAERGDMGPFPEMQSIERDARPLSDWASEAEAERQGKKHRWLCTAVAALAGVGGLLMWSSAPAREPQY